MHAPFRKFHRATPWMINLNEVNTICLIPSYSIVHKIHFNECWSCHLPSQLEYARERPLLAGMYKSVEVFCRETNDPFALFLIAVRPSVSIVAVLAVSRVCRKS